MEKKSDVLSKELEHIAEKELNEKSAWRERDITVLRQMIRDNAESPGCLTDEFLLRFLRARKFDYDRALSLYLNHYEVRKKYPQVFDGLTLASVAHIIQAGISCILPGFDCARRKVFLFRPGIWSPETSSYFDLIRANYLCVEQILQHSEVQIRGIVLLIDMTDFTVQHIQSLGISFARIAARFLQNCTPIRVRAVHFVNGSNVVSTAFNLVRPFLKDKLVKRAVFHGTNYTELHRYIPPETLPSNGKFQGFGPDLPVPGYFESLKADESYFEELNRYDVDEQLSRTSDVSPLVLFSNNDVTIKNETGGSAVRNCIRGPCFPATNDSASSGSGEE